MSSQTRTRRWRAAATTGRRRPRVDTTRSMSHPRLLLRPARGTPCRSPDNLALLPSGPRSSGDRAPPSGGGSAGSNPAGGASFLPCGRSRRRCTTTARGAAPAVGVRVRGPPHAPSGAVASHRLCGTRTAASGRARCLPGCRAPPRAARRAAGAARPSAALGHLRALGGVGAPRRRAPPGRPRGTRPRPRPLGVDHPGEVGAGALHGLQHVLDLVAGAHGGQPAYALERDRLARCWASSGVEDVLQVQVAGRARRAASANGNREKPRLATRPLDVGRGGSDVQGDQLVQRDGDVAGDAGR